MWSRSGRALFLCLCLSLGAATWGQLKPSRIYDIAKPATALVITTYSTELQIPSAQANVENLGALAERIEAEVRAGGLSQEEDKVLDYVVRQITGDFERYISPAEPYPKVEARIDGVGSGFFITPDGYLLTNAHVVEDDHENLKLSLAIQGLTEAIDKEMQKLQQELHRKLSEAHVHLLREAWAEFFARHMRMRGVRTSLTVLTAVAQENGTVAMVPLPAVVGRVALGQPTPGKDVAVLKVKGDNFFTLALGDDSALNPGDEMYAIGFPADATFFPGFDPESTSEPSMTRGILSSRKRMAAGWTVLQTDAAIRGGNSGGPVLNTQGEVVGLATFGLADPVTGAEAAGVSFVVPASVAREFLIMAKVSPRESEVTRLYKDALEQKDKGYYKTALARLKEVDRLRPRTPSILRHIEDCEKAIAQGRGSS